MVGEAVGRGMAGLVLKEKAMSPMADGGSSGLMGLIPTQRSRKP